MWLKTKSGTYINTAHVASLHPEQHWGNQPGLLMVKAVLPNGTDQTFEVTEADWRMFVTGVSL